MPSLLLVFVLAFQQSPVAQPSRRTAPTVTTLEVRVTNRSGEPIAGARVTATGASSREATTDANGSVTLKTMSPGAYRLRVEGEAFIALEKELTLRAGVPASTQLALSAAPPPAEPAPAPPVDAPLSPEPTSLPTGAPGEPRVLSITELAEHSLSGREGMKVVPIGCTGSTNARLIVLRDEIAPGSYADADEELYVVAGEASLTLGERQQALVPGWFALVPRATRFAIVRKGRNPVVLLSLLSGRPCSTGGLESRP